MLEHVATGRFYMGQSEHVSRDVDSQLKQLAQSKHPNKLLNELYQKDSDIRLYEYPLKAKKERKSLLVNLRDNTYPSYLCLNPGDVR